MLREEIAQTSHHLASQEGPGEDSNWWQDLARTLQLRINQLEDEVRRLQIAKTRTDLNSGTPDPPSDDILEQEPLKEGSVEVGIDDRTDKEE